MEPEYMSLSEAARQMIWPRHALNKVNRWTTKNHADTLLDNYSGLLDLTRNPVFHQQAKHIETHCYYIRERFATEDFVLSYVPIADNVADILTKPLGRIKHVGFLKLFNCLEQRKIFE